MTYEDTLLEEAEDLLHFDSSVLLEASSGGRGRGNGGNNQKNTLGFFDKIKNGQYLPGSEKVKGMVKVGALKPYGFEGVDITDTKKLKQVMASIKRRRDIESARALLVGTIEAGAGLLFGGISHVSSVVASDPETYGTGIQGFASGSADVFKVMAIVSGVLALFTEVMNAIDAVKANKAVAQVRQNIMDAYDRLSTKIMNTKPGMSQKSAEEYHAMLSYRDMLRDCQLKLGNFGGSGANTYVSANF